MKNEFMAGVGTGVALSSPMLFGSVPLPVVIVLAFLGLVISSYFSTED